MSKLSHEPVSGGHAIYRDGFFKLAVVNTAHNKGLARDGIGIQEPIAKEDWVIHWCSPHMKVEEAAAVVAYVQALPLAPSI